MTSRPPRIVLDVEAVGSACFVLGLILAPSLLPKLEQGLRERIANEDARNLASSTTPKTKKKRATSRKERTR